MDAKKPKKNQRAKDQSVDSDPNETPKQDKPSSGGKIFLTVLGVLATLIGVATGSFQLWKDLNEVAATSTPIPTVPLTFTPVPTNTPLFTPGPLTFFELPKEIHAGNNMRVVVQAWEGAVCALDFYTPGGNKSDAEGLGVKSPDSLHRCTWTWRVNANTHEGTGRIFVKVGELEEEHTLKILP